MAVRVILPRPLRSCAGGVAELGIESDTVAQVLQVLEETYPDLTPYLRDEQGTLFPKVNVYVNDEHVRYLQGVQTPLQDGDQVYIVPLVMGG
jgi:molybdopterin synthase sulfur carrier subunit